MCIRDRLDTFPKAFETYWPGLGGIDLLVEMCIRDRSKYFGKEITPREMKDQIIKLLDDWQGQQKEHEKPEKKTEQEK